MQTRRQRPPRPAPVAQPASREPSPPPVRLAAGNRAAARALTSGRALARLRIGDDPTTPDARVIAAALRLHFPAIASEVPASRKWLDMREKTRKRLAAWAREGKGLKVPRIDEAPSPQNTDPHTYDDWDAAIRAAYVAEGGKVATAPVAEIGEGGEAAPEETAKRVEAAVAPVIESRRGQPLPEKTFREAVRTYLGAPPAVDDAEGAEAEIWEAAKGIVTQIGTLTGQLAKNEKGTPHQSQHPKALAKLKFIMVGVKLTMLKRSGGVSPKVLAQMERQKSAFRKESERKGATHHFR
ncbi:MAG TPA: hypothetical protein VHF51_05980 [Solirubrobacteraceae bacterium]|nr:hypothetical protein [Solirubrobacteraceae bacterium]